MRWQEMEYYAFAHFALNTFTDQSWGFGDEDINLFNPKELNVRQWARICRESGMKGVTLTAKHHTASVSALQIHGVFGEECPLARRQG